MGVSTFVVAEAYCHVCLYDRVGMSNITFMLCCGRTRIPNSGPSVAVVETIYIVRPNLAEINNGEIIVGKKKWDALPPHLRAIIEECTCSAGVDFLKWTGYNDIIDIKAWNDKKMGEMSTLDQDSVAQMRKFSIEVVDEYSKKDPKYCTKAGELLKTLMKMTGRI